MKSARRVCLTPCNADATAYAYLMKKEENANISVQHPVYSDLLNKTLNARISSQDHLHLQHPAKTFISFWVIFHPQ